VPFVAAGLATVGFADRLLATPPVNTSRPRSPLIAARPVEPPLKFVESFNHPDLTGVSFVALSSDGKVCLTNGGRQKTVTTLFVQRGNNGIIAINSKSRVGELTLLQLDRSNGRLTYIEGRPVQRFDIEPLVAKSRDGRFLVVSSKSDPAILNFAAPVSSNVEQIQVLDSFSELAGFTGIELSFDGRNAYLASNFLTNANDRTPSARRGCIRVFERLRDDRLEWAQSFRVENGCLDHAEALYCHPGGKTLFACCPETDQLVVCSRDPKSGCLKLREILANGANGIRCLEGINAVDCSPDGQFIYTVAGYERGDGAIGVFRLLPTGQMELVQQFLHGDPGLDGFFGGHSIVVSPDGRCVYATATLLNTIACFERDPLNGRLHSLGCIHHRKNGALIPHPTGLAVHPNNRFVYVACHYPGSIAVFEDTSRPHHAPQ